MDSKTDLAEVVVNARMNRGRGLSGVNSYRRELRGFDIAAFLNGRCQRFPERTIRWLDFGCGEGHALRELANSDNAPGRLSLVGIDLAIPDETVATPDRPRLEFRQEDIAERLPEGTFDLVTGVHTLHYVKDKLGLLEQLYRLITSDGGMLLAHIDPINVCADSDTGVVNRDRLWNRALRQAQRENIEIRYRDGLIRIERTPASNSILRFQTRFVGCRVSEKPNRSGMIVVDSLYE